MMAYLRARAREPSTWIALTVFVASVVIFWYYRGQIYTHIAATLALFKAAAKDGIERRMMDWFRSFFTKPAVSGALILPKEVPVSDIVKTLEAGAFAALKAVPLPAPYGALVSAVVSAVENPSIPNVLTAIGDVVSIAQALEAAPPPTTASVTAVDEVAQ